MIVLKLCICYDIFTSQTFRYSMYLQVRFQLITGRSPTISMFDLSSENRRDAYDCLTLFSSAVKR